MSCKPVLNGVLWNLGPSFSADGFTALQSSAKEWRTDLDDLCRVGLKKIMLFAHVPYALKNPGKAADDILDFIFRECSERGLEVIVAAGGLEGKFHPSVDAFDISSGSPVREYVDMIYKRYADYPSFAGWYIDYEFCIQEGETMRKLREIYRISVELCKKRTPDLPVVASPFFNPPTEGNVMHVGFYTPQDYADVWSDMISYSHFDVLALQDNGGQHLSFFTERDTEPFIAAYAEACRENNCRFWGNVETGELEVDSAQDFFRRFGKDGNCNSKECAPYWRPVPIGRLKKKLELMSKYSECNLSWGYQLFYRPRLGDRAANAYKDYETYLKEKFPEVIR